MEIRQTFTLESSTLAALRELVEETASWPANAEVRVRVRADFNAAGGRARSVTLDTKK